MRRVSVFKAGVVDFESTQLGTTVRTAVRVRLCAWQELPHPLLLSYLHSCSYNYHIQTPPLTPLLPQGALLLYTNIYKHIISLAVFNVDVAAALTTF